MRSLLALALLVVVIPLAGCEKKKPAAAKSTEPLVPTSNERQILRAHGLTAQSERGQMRLVKIRLRQEKLKASRDRVRGWAEARAKAQAEHPEEEARNPLAEIISAAQSRGSVGDSL